MTFSNSEAYSMAVWSLREYLHNKLILQPNNFTQQVIGYEKVNMLVYNYFHVKKRRLLGIVYFQHLRLWK